MLVDKGVVYDWDGANVVLFKSINAIQGDSYDMAMVLVSRMADYHNFLFYFILLTLWALLNSVWRKLRSRGGARQHLIMWFGALSVFAAGFAANAVIIHHAKQYFAYPRPYAVLATHDVHVHEDRKDSDDSKRSFPSGHTAFITLLVMSLWPMLTRSGQWLGLGLIVLVGWSRIALGMHFPADVLGGLILSLLVVLFTRMIIYRIYRAFNLYC